ncbi:hypothetical protein [Halocatena halophila]|uniref:hypothetical protein n=1 Tax=Halocatena halophila TaxID=2814576 RepID=UPI002ED4C179
MAEQPLSTATVKTFASRFIERQFVAATHMLTDDGRATIVEECPEFLPSDGMDATDVLESYWWGLHAQYGTPTSIGNITEQDGGISVTFTFENVTETVIDDLGAWITETSIR